MLTVALVSSMTGGSSLLAILYLCRMLVEAWSGSAAAVASAVARAMLKDSVVS